MAHCGIKKPKDFPHPATALSLRPNRIAGSSGFAARRLQGQQALNVQEDARKSGRGHSRGHSLPQGVLGTSDRRHDRSRSPRREKEDGRGHLTLAGLRDQYRDRRSPRATVTAGGPHLRGGDGNTQPTEPRKKVTGSNDTPLGLATNQARANGTGNHAPSLTATPQAILWSDGSATAPSVRELVVHDPWISMVIHQTVRFADFFQRHPEVAKGEDLVSGGMSQYLSEIRNDQPAYLSASGESDVGATQNAGANGQNTYANVLKGQGK